MSDMRGKSKFVTLFSAGDDINNSSVSHMNQKAEGFKSGERKVFF